MQLALVPDVVAGGEHVGAQVEEILGDLRRDAEAAGGVFGVDDDQFDLVCLRTRDRCARARSCAPRCRRCRRRKECSKEQLLASSCQHCSRANEADVRFSDI